ncbi:MAG TPA: aminoacyl-tRNA hydrolase, partial [Marinilabiliales bacterium]|nr:aminoacyl-tRNA hydrolase [Marinilabiliales bacterium]
MKYLIAGLGNIGYEYANTRHNIGFQVLDALAKAS